MVEFNLEIEILQHSQQDRKNRVAQGESRFSGSKNRKKPGFWRWCKTLDELRTQTDIAPRHLIQDLAAICFQGTRTY